MYPDPGRRRWSRARAHLLSHKARSLPQPARPGAAATAPRRPPATGELITSRTLRCPRRFIAAVPCLQVFSVASPNLTVQPHLLPELRLTEKGRVHGEWVRQVSFYSSLHCIVSCATCPDSLLMCDLAGSKTYNMFHVEKVRLVLF